MKQFFLILLAFLVLVACNPAKEEVKVESVAFGKSVVVYKGGVTEKQAKTLGNHLVERGLLNKKQKDTVQVSKQDDVYLVKLLSDDWKNINKGQRLLMWKEEYVLGKEGFDGADARFVFVSDEDTKGDVLEPVAKYAIGESAVYYDDGEFDKKLVQKLANFFKEKEYMAEDKAVDVFLTKEEGTPVVRLVVNKEKVDEQEAQLIPVFSYWQSLIQDEVFNSKKAKMVLASVQMKDFKTVPKYTDEMKAIVEGPKTNENETTTIDSLSTQTTVSGIERIRD